MNYNPSTFGNHPAAQILADKLQNANERIQTKVGRLLGRYSSGIRYIAQITEPRIRMRLLHLWLQDHIAKIPTAPEIESWVENVMKAIHGEAVKKFRVSSQARRLHENKNRTREMPLS